LTEPKQCVAFGGIVWAPKLLHFLHRSKPLLESPAPVPCHVLLAIPTVSAELSQHLHRHIHGQMLGRLDVVHITDFEAPSLRSNNLLLTPLNRSLSLSGIFSVFSRPTYHKLHRIKQFPFLRITKRADIAQNFENAGVLLKDNATEWRVISNLPHP